MDKSISILLQNRFPEVFSLLDICETDNTIEVVTTKQGEKVPLVLNQGRKVAVHSKFDPYKEAERFLGNMQLTEYDVIFVFGFGFGYHIELLLKQVGRDCIVIAVEKDVRLIKAAFEHRDLSAVLSDKRFFLLVDPDEQKLSETLKGKSSSNVSFITHRGSYGVNPDFYQHAVFIAKTYVSTKAVNIATLSKFEKAWSSNIARNILHFFRAPGINIFSHAFQGVPALIVCAGPSLYESIDFIRHERKNCVIIAVDTALKILLGHGIEPHFCIAVDPQVINARYFEGIPGLGTVLVTDPTVHPSVYHFFKGRTISTGVAFDLMKWIEKIGGEKGTIAHGGSVSTNAYDFARQLGCAPLVMVGQDLAFTRGLAHCRGSYLEAQVSYRVDRLYSLEMFNYKQLTALPKIRVKGISGGDVHTNQKMMIFINWFEKRNDASLINATVEGASIPGVEHVPYEKLCFETPKIVIGDKISSLYDAYSKQTSNQQLEKLSKSVTGMLSEIEALVPVLHRAVGMTETLESSLNAKNRDQQKINYILQKLAETDKIIESQKSIKDIISVTIQKVIHTIKEGYDIDENDQNTHDEALVAKRSHYLYKGLLDGAMYSRKVLHKMLRLSGTHRN